jgi:hypothetical protein
MAARATSTPTDEINRMFETAVGKSFTNKGGGRYVREK